jgi:peptidoglycan/xylan/chitin deacetylase (PgdA/CDA1 family)
LAISDFTYNFYIKLIGLISRNGYTFANYHDWQIYDNPCILRHDIDFDIEKAVFLAKIEATEQIQSTYFVLLNTDFYNLSSKKNNGLIKEIQKMGHEIGLHFDETLYALYTPPPNIQHIIRNIQREIKILESIIDAPVTTVSMHRPSKFILESDMVIPDIVNSYDQNFFKKFKYLSDSRHAWREDVESVVVSKRHERLHILTHPFWYTEEKELCKDKLLRFIIDGKQERYISLVDNFQRLDEYIMQEDIQ